MLEHEDESTAKLMVAQGMIAVRPHSKLDHSRAETEALDWYLRHEYKWTTEIENKMTEEKNGAVATDDTMPKWDGSGAGSCGDGLQQQQNQPPQEQQKEEAELDEKWEETRKTVLQQAKRVRSAYNSLEVD